ncbi:MAG: phage portal protein [Clostridia bacterium]|nr:phage portal protein [Clostridia bacterium]
MATHIKTSMTDKQFLEKEIASWLNSPIRKMQFDSVRYYEGNHDILGHKRMVINEKGDLEENKNLVNNQIVDNQYSRAVDKKVNYFCGLPFTFDTKNKAYAEALNNYFTPKRRKKIKTAAKKAILGGKSWVFPYYEGESNELEYLVYPAESVLPFWADEEHTILDCAVHFYPVVVYNHNAEKEIVFKADIIHGGGMDKCIWEDGSLIPDPDAESGNYISVTNPDTGKVEEKNWGKIPFICFKGNENEIPLIKKVKCLQDALNTLHSNLMNAMEENVHNTVLVIHNYDGTNLGEFRKNLAAYQAIKVRGDGKVEPLKLEFDVSNAEIVEKLIRKAIIENAGCYDGKDERLSSTPNQLNIKSMYMDMDLDNNELISEFQAGFEELLYFINAYFANAGIGNFEGEKVDVIFNPDVLINESETIDNINKSADLSLETRIKMHPYVKDAEEELQRIKKEREEAMKQQDPYRNAFESQKNSGKGNEGGEPVNEE